MTADGRVDHRGVLLPFARVPAPDDIDDLDDNEITRAEDRATHHAPIGGANEA